MRENEASSETWYFLNKLGDESAQIDRTEVSGLIVAHTKLEPSKVVNSLREMAQEKPWDFRYILKVTPIQIVSLTNLERLAETSSQLADRIGETETFRITVNKRHSHLKSADIVKVVADGIQRKVNLENPSKVIYVEVIGDKTGISVLKPSDVLSISKIKEEASRIVTEPPDVEEENRESAE